MDTFAYIPSAGSKGAMRPRKLSAQFGDGYMQEAPDGINARLRSWELVFDPIHATTPTGASGANLDDINDFLEAHKGTEKFLWVQPTPFDVEGAKMFVCGDWDFVYDKGGAVVALRALFEQRPS